MNKRMGALPDDRRTVARISLSHDQRDSLGNMIHESCGSLIDPQKSINVLTHTGSSILRKILTPTQLRTAERFSNPAFQTAIVVENLAIGKFGATPADGLQPADKCITSEAVILGIAGLLGFPLGYSNEKRGEIVQQVVPIDSPKTNLNSNASRQRFGFHVDNIFIKPDYRQQVIGLLCLRNPSQAATLLLDLPDLVNAMTEEMFDWALQPNCRFPVSASFDVGGKQLLTEPRSILYTGRDGMLRINANAYNMRGVTEDDNAMITKFSELTNSINHHRLVLEPGQMLLFRDDFAMHGREPFEGDRWLQRVYVRFDLEALLATTNDRSARVFDVKNFYFN